MYNNDFLGIYYIRFYRYDLLYYIVSILNGLLVSIKIGLIK